MTTAAVSLVGLRALAERSAAVGSTAIIPTVPLLALIEAVEAARELYGRVEISPIAHLDEVGRLAAALAPFEAPREAHLR